MSDDVKKDDEPEVAATPDLSENEVNVVTTALGTLGSGGIAAIGTKATITVQAFSKEWMRPATMGDRNKLVKAGKLPKPVTAKTA